MQVSASIFKAYDIRGIVGQTIDARFAEHLGRAFGSEAVDRRILQHLRETLQLGQCELVERWVGYYPTGAGRDCVIEAPDAATRVVVVSSGTGASTAFGIAEEVFQNW